MAYIAKFNNGTTDIPFHPLFGTCDTNAGIAAKVVEDGTAASFDELVAGAVVIVHFQQTNTAADPTLKVGTTSAAAIKHPIAGSIQWYAGDVIPFVYDGTYWRIIGMNAVAAE